MRGFVLHVRGVTTGAAAALLLAGCLPQTARVSPERVREAQESARQAIADERKIDAASISPRTIAVPPLRLAIADTALAPLSYGLADLLMSDLAQSSRLRVVDRVRLSALLRELDLAGSGRVDPATAPRVGKLVQARQLVVGSIGQRRGDGIVLDVRIADVLSGEVRSAVNATSSVEDILDAEKELVYRIFNQLGITVTAAERARIEQHRTRNIAALLAYSRGVLLDVQGNFEAAAQEYGRASALDAAFTAGGLRGRDSQGRPPSPIAAAGTPLTRAAAAATEHVNTTASFAPNRPGGGSVDPQISAITSARGTIIITVVLPMILPPR